MSLPVQGAWIEIMSAGHSGCSKKPSLPVQGAWIEIIAGSVAAGVGGGRSPCRERGLKSPSRRPTGEASSSLPVQGAWIEIRFGNFIFYAQLVAPRAGSVD